MNDRRDDSADDAVVRADRPEHPPATLVGSSPGTGPGAVVADALAQTLKDPAPRPFAGLVVGAFAVVVLLFASLVVVGGAAVQAQVGRVNAFGGLTSRPLPMANGSANVLVAVTDVTPGAKAGTPAHLAHVVVVHLARDGHATLVRLPVSSLLTVAAHQGRDGAGVAAGAHPLAFAYADGGARLLAQTVERATSLRMDGYAQVSLPALAGVAGTDGLPVCLPEQVDDTTARLRLPAGQQDLDGRKLLSLLRAGGDGTLAQVRRYQLVAGALLQEFFQPQLVAPIGTAAYGPAAAAVSVDDGFDVTLARRLALALRNPYAGTASVLSVPYTGTRTSKDGTVTPWNRQLASVLFDRIGHDDPVDVALFTPATIGVKPAAIPVRVENGTDVVNLAEKVSTELRAAGFHVAGTPRTAQGRHARTTIYPGPKHRAEAAAVQQAIPGSTVRPIKHQPGVMLVIAGENYDGVRQVEYVKGSRSTPVTVPRPQVDTSGDCAP